MGTYQLADQRYPEHGLWSSCSEIGKYIAWADLVRRGKSRKDRYERSYDLRHNEDENEMKSA